ncbi:MAG: class I SAM-dependent methyltransferase [Candidatus Acidiferrum sp.]
MATPTMNRPTPERIFTTLNAFQQTEALKAGIELEIFTAIGEGTNTLAALAKKTGASDRGLKALCDYLTVLGFLTKDAGQYSLTQESALFLNRKSPAYLGTLAAFLVGDELRTAHTNLTETVRSGRPAVNGDNTKPKDEFWVNFARSMAPITVPSAMFITELTGMADGNPCKVLDIAAGHGMYGINMAKRNSNAQVTAVDWPSVLQVAKENAQAAGVAGRYTTRAGSAFETDLGEGYDYTLLTNIFHHFSPSACERLMKRVHAALKPGGKAVTLEFVPNEDRVSPPVPAMFSLMMLATTDEGDAFTFAEYEKMFANAGFTKTTLHRVPDMPQSVLLSEK